MQQVIMSILHKTFDPLQKTGNATSIHITKSLHSSFRWFIFKLHKIFFLPIGRLTLTAESGWAESLLSGESSFNCSPRCSTNRKCCVTEQFVAQLPPYPPSLTIDALFGQNSAASHSCGSHRDANIQSLNWIREGKKPQQWLDCLFKLKEEKVIQKYGSPLLCPPFLLLYPAGP